MDLSDTPLSGSAKLFPQEALEKAVERSSQVLHDEVIRKALTINKPPKKAAKRLYFSQVALPAPA